jgi:hypothetical protein
MAPTFMTLALDGSEKSASPPGKINPGIQGGPHRSGRRGFGHNFDINVGKGACEQRNVHFAYQFALQEHNCRIFL